MSVLYSHSFFFFFFFSKWNISKREMKLSKVGFFKKKIMFIFSLRKS